MSKTIIPPHQAITRPRKQQRDAAEQFITTLKGMTFPNAKRIYQSGSRPDIRVPMREIQQSATLISGKNHPPSYQSNPAIPVYDTSGPYGDPQSKLDVHIGLPQLRANWIKERQDTEALLTVRANNI